MMDRDSRQEDSAKELPRADSTNDTNGSTMATWSNPDTRRPQDLQQQSGPGRGGDNRQPQSKREMVWEAVRTIKPRDFLELHKTPCAREGWLTGIGMGAAAGALRFILGGMCTFWRST